MTFNKFQKMSARTINKDLSGEEVELHALHEIAGEVGEIHSIYQKVYQGHDFDEENLKEEIGDLLWGIAELCTSRGYSLEEIAQFNVDKLLGRYPNGFDPERSKNRKV